MQHMPENFTKAFADRLAKICTMEVREARDRDSLAPGVALVAPGNRHMVLQRSGSAYERGCYDRSFCSTSGDGSCDLDAAIFSRWMAS